jgi:hypothetical protein
MVTPVKDNLLVIRMDVAGLTQWGSSWRRERACGRVGFERIVEICGKVKCLTFKTDTWGTQPKMFDEGHRFGRMGARKATKRNVNYPTLAQPNPQGWGTRGKKREAKSKPAPPAKSCGMASKELWKSAEKRKAPCATPAPGAPGKIAAPERKGTRHVR